MPLNNIIVLSPNDPEIHRAWGVVRNYDTDLGISDPGMAWNDTSYENWQYMCSYKKGEQWYHEFRHRCHPAIGKRVYLRPVANMIIGRL